MSGWGDLLYHIVSTAGLEASKIRSADQRACAYDQKPITLDGQIDLNISFGENTLCTTVYIKLVAPDALLLSEAVCRTLGVVSYHPNVQAVQKGPVTITPITIPIKEDILPLGEDQDMEFQVSMEAVTTVEVRSRTPGELANNTGTTPATEPAQILGSDMNDEPSLQEPSELECVLKQELGSISQVSLIKTVRLPANSTAVVPVQVLNEKDTFMLEPSDSLDTSLKIVESLIEVKEDGSSAVVVANTGKSTYQLQKGMDLDQVVEVELVVAKDEDLPVVCEGSVEEAVKPLLDQVNLFGISLQSEKTVE